MPASPPSERFWPETWAGGFIDLDDVIEASSKRTVAEIFRELGEANFREQERQAVRQLSNEEKIVLALGGGTVEDESTRSLLLHSPGNCLVFLEAELPELLARCTVEGKVRPLLAAPESLEARHTRRLPYYRDGPRYRGNYRACATGGGRSSARAECPCSG